MDKTLEELQEEYDLELDKIIRVIKKMKVKRVLLQFPDGLKPYSLKIADELKKRTRNKVDFFIWFGSCYGGCDIPVLGKNEKEVDLVVQFGHSAWDYGKKSGIEVVRV